MTDQASAGHQHETAADPKGMAETPQDLPDGLRVTTDSDDPSGIKAHLRLEHRWYFQQVVGGWVQEQEADGRHDPDQGHHAGEALKVPEADSVVAVGEEIPDHHNR